MKPRCKLCGSPHWTYEGHTINEELRKVGAAVLRNTVTKPRGDHGLPPDLTDDHGVYVPTNKRTEPLTGRNKRTRGRPRKWASEAERKKAYRERSTK